LSFPESIDAPEHTANFLLALAEPPPYPPGASGRPLPQNGLAVVPRRPLLPIALAGVSGTALGPLLPEGLLLLAAGACALGVLASRRRALACRAPALIVAATLLGTGSLAGYRAHRVDADLRARGGSPAPGGPCELLGHLQRPAWRDAYARHVFTVLTQTEARIEVVSTQSGPPRLGELALQGRFQPLDARRNRRLARRGATARFVATRVHAVAAPARLSWLDGIRAHARALIRGAVAPARQPLFCAVLLGDPPALRPNLRDAFRRSGTAHLLSLSGLHVGLLAGLVFACCRVLGLPADHRRWFVVAALLVYLAIAGPRVPTLRATAAGLVFFVAPQRGDAWNRLAGAALLVLLWDPAALWDLGFHLSFGTVAGLLALSRALDGVIPRMERGRWLRMAAIGALAAFLASTPLLAITLGQLPFAALVVGPPAIALFTGILGLGLAGVSCGALVPWLGLRLLGAADLLTRPLVGLVETSAAWRVDVQLAQLPSAPVSLVAIGLLSLGAVRREGGRPHRTLLGLGAVTLLAAIASA
jgi:ComEC/Rec2-related protein